MLLADELRYQLADDEHIPFVAKSWMKSMRLAPEYRDLDDDTYYTWAKDHVSNVLKSSDILVAVDPEDTDIIIGFVVFQDKNASWAYVRKDWRKSGVYGRLKEYSGIESYDHRSDRWNHVRGGLSWCPWFL